jgi:Domain of unknown function (DUF222)/HNH endonuclease
MYDSVMLLEQYADRVLISPEQLAEQWRDLEQRMAVFAYAVAHVHDTGRWADDGSVTMRTWMRNHLRMADQQAGHWLAQAKMLNRYEQVGEAALDGTLSQGQLAELRRLDQPRYRPLLRELQQDLLDAVKGLDAAGTATACQVWRQRADALLDDGEPPAEASRSLRFQRADDRQLLGHFSLHDAAATEFEQAIDTAATHEGADDTRTLTERRADALHDIAAFYNKHHGVAATPRHHPHITLSLDAATLQQPLAIHSRTGVLASPTCTDTNLCDCILHTVLRDPHQAPVGYGRARYTVPRSLFRHLAARDGGCRFPGCNRPVSYCEAHHITYWRNGGTTDPHNLVLLCNRHHHVVHQQQLGLSLQPDATLRVTWADHRTATSLPRGAPPRAPARAPARDPDPRVVAA